MQQLAGFCRGLYSSTSAQVARSTLSHNLRTFRSTHEAATHAVQAAASEATTSFGFKSLRMLAQCYKQLSKAKLSLLVMSTSCAGYVLGSGEEIDYPKLGWTALGTFAAAASANTLNQVYEIANDSLMKRTRNRPLPTGRLSVPHALGFAAVTGIGGVAILMCKTNATTAALGAANIGLYAGVYTPLKVLSICNTQVGAIVGAIPPLMGYAAASGKLDYGAWILAAGLYFWQLPHFLSLAWLCREDYARGGYKMLSVLDSTGRRTAAAAFRNCVYLFPLGMIAVMLGVATYSFAYHSAVVTGALAATSAAFYQCPTNLYARTLFRASLLHLPLWMAGLLLYRIPYTADADQLLKTKLQLSPGIIPVDAPLQSVPQPPFGMFSVAPFPLLPVPMYHSPLAPNDSSRSPKDAGHNKFGVQ